MKKLIILMAILATTVGIADAQSNNTEPKTKGFGWDGWTQYNTTFSEFDAIAVTIAPSYTFNRTLFARLQIDGERSMWDRSNLKTWQGNLTLGPGVGANFWRFNNGNVLGVAAAAGSSLFNKSNEWSYLYYDLGVEHVKSKHFLTGIGVRYYDSKHSGFRNRTTFYLKFGFRF